MYFQNDIEITYCVIQNVAYLFVSHDNYMHHFPRRDTFKLMVFSNLPLTLSKNQNDIRQFTHG